MAAPVHEPGMLDTDAQIEHLLLEGCRLIDEAQMQGPQGDAPAS